MNILFGFAGRLGRLNYFLLSCALGLITTLLIFMLISALAPHYTEAHRAAPDQPPAGMVLIIAAIILPFFTWFSLALQAKRFRDIGWRPLYVIPGWIAAVCLDWCVALVVPSLAIGDSDQTLAGVLINLAMVGCLLFWPSGPDYGDDSEPRLLAPNGSGNDVSASVVAAAPSRIPRGPAPSPGGFGRRVA